MLSNYVRDEAIGGLSAGIVGTIIGFPLDLIKTRMQTTTFNTKINKVTGKKKNISNGIINIGVHIVRSEGILALYKGLMAPLISLSLLNTINFTSYSILQQKVFYGVHSSWDVRNAVSGMCVGPIASSISTVEGVVKTQMQLNNVTANNNNNSKGIPKYKNTLECVRALYHTRHNANSINVRVFYVGHSVNTLRECVFISTYFYVYEGLKYEFSSISDNVDNDVTTSNDNKDNNNNNTIAAWSIPLAGGISGALSWCVSFPLDCIRAGVQGQPLLSLSRRNDSNRKNALQITRELWRSKGILGLYSGITPSIIRAFLVSGSRFSAYEAALWVLQQSRN